MHKADNTRKRTTVQKIYKRARFTILGMNHCGHCPPGRGCNKKNTRKQRTWKVLRKKQYKVIV